MMFFGGKILSPSIASSAAQSHATWLRSQWLTLLFLGLFAAACGGGQPYDDETGTPGQKDGETDVPPSVSSFVATSFAEESQSIITLDYTDSNNDQATSCSVSNPNHVSVTQACVCASGVCTVGVTGANNYAGVGWFNFTVTANGKLSNSATVNFTITNVDDAPTVSDITPIAFNEDTQSTITLSYTDVDGDLATSCSVANLTNVSESAACACAAGVCTVGVTGAPNYVGAASFTYLVTANGQVAGTPATATLTLSQVDDAPVSSAISPAAFNEDAQSVVTLSYTDLESDAATACTISNPINVSVTQACACAAGVCTVGVTGDADYYGDAYFDYTVTANGQTSNTSTATLAINAVNDAPVLNKNILYPTAQGSTITISAAYLDFNDVDDLDSVITYEITSAPTKGTLKNNGSAMTAGSTFTQQSVNANLITYQHTAGDTIDDTFSFKVYDDDLLESANANTASPATFSINISDCVGGSQTFTANGTFTVPAGCSVIVVRSWGGGGGAGVGSTGQANGGPGGYATATVASSGGAQFNVVIGQGGLSGCNGRTAGVGGYAGGAGGLFSAAGLAGSGTGVGGAGGTASGNTGVGGAGKYGGGGGGGGKNSGQNGGGGGGASLFETSGGTDLVIAGGGGGGGGSNSTAIPNGGSGCGVAGTAGSGQAGGGGGGGACLGDSSQTGSGTAPGNSAGAGGAATGGAGPTCSDGGAGKVIVDYS